MQTSRMVLLLPHRDSDEDQYPQYDLFATDTSDAEKETAVRHLHVEDKACLVYSRLSCLDNNKR